MKIEIEGNHVKSICVNNDDPDYQFTDITLTNGDVIHIGHGFSIYVNEPEGIIIEI